MKNAVSSRFALLLALCALFMTGCVNLRPELYSPPTKEDLAKAGSALYTGPGATGKLQDFIDYTDQLAAWHDDKARGLRKEQAWAEELGFTSAVVAVIAGATEHLHAARAAAVAGAGTTLFSDRYKLKVQATTYESAAKAFLCMRDRLADVKPLDERVRSADASLSAVDFVPELRPFIRDSVVSVLRKLQSKLRAIDLPTPDLTKLKDSVGKMFQGQNAVRGFAFQNAVDLDPVKALKGNIQACEATFD